MRSATMVTMVTMAYLACGCGSKGGDGAGTGSTNASASPEKPNDDTERFVSYARYDLLVPVTFADTAFKKGDGDVGSVTAEESCAAYKDAAQQLLKVTPLLEKMSKPAPGLGKCPDSLRAKAHAVEALAVERLKGGSCAELTSWRNDTKADWKTAYCAFAVAMRECGNAAQAAGFKDKFTELDSSCK